MEERKRDVLQALVEYLKYLEFFYQTSHLQNWMDGAATIFSIWTALGSNPDHQLSKRALYPLRRRLSVIWL